VPSSVNAAAVRRIARLARLNLTDDEAAQFSGQLSRIIDYMELLQSAPTDGVEPLNHPIPLSNVLRPDEPRPGLTTEQALYNAPQHDSQYFRVPAVLDGGSGA
jgi:aspartyl-tRNA(Asn)/glutamyl-tRNA(Gln) amidotransferase subunit C